jgi:serine phosphatase RsbU (regulator of sigma subunit)
MYLAAEEESAIGGDLYAAAARGRSGARVLVGDVQGKGLAAVEVAGLLLGAFRRAARADIPLDAVPGYLDDDLREDLADLADLADEDGVARDRGQSAGTNFLEGFVTAVVIDVADENGGGLSIANCGHPPPLLIHDGTVEQLFPGVPGLPLGLGDLTRQTQHIDTYDMAVGDVLLLYTDGVTEARDAEGTFYPLDDRLARWTADSPDALLEAIRDDLLHYVDARLADDIAMVAVQRVS